MSEAFFDLEQRAALRAVLPAGADDVRIEWAMHTLGKLAATEATSPQIGPARSYREQRDNWVNFKATVEACARALLKVRPPRRTPDEDWWTTVPRGLGHLHAEAADTVASLEPKVKENSGRKDTHREEINAQVLHVWERLGGSLNLRKSSGPVVPYAKLVISLIFDEEQKPDATIVDAIRRYKRRQKGLPPRKRKRVHKRRRK